MVLPPLHLEEGSGAWSLERRRSRSVRVMQYLQVPMHARRGERHMIFLRFGSFWSVITHHSSVGVAVGERAPAVGSSSMAPCPCHEIDLERTHVGRNEGKEERQVNAHCGCVKNGWNDGWLPNLLLD